MSEKEKFQKLAKEYFTWLYRNYPVAATSLGIHRFDDRLTDLGKEAIGRRLLKTRQFLVEFKKIKPSELDLTVVNDLSILKNELEWEIISEEKIKYWQKAPSLYSDEIIWGLYFLLNRSFASLEVRAKNLLSRLKVAPLVLEQAEKNLSQPVSLWVEIGRDSVKGGMVFLETQIPDFAKKVKDKNLKMRILTANQKLAKSLKEYLRFLDRVKKEATPEFSLGKALFEQKLKLAQVLDYSPEELLKIGWKIFKQTEKKLQKSADLISVGNSWWQVTENLKKYYPKETDLLKVYRQEVRQLKEFLRKKRIVSLPEKEKLKVISTPESERATTPYAAYLPPAPFEKDQTGQFWVTPIDKQRTKAQQKQQLAEHAFNHLALTVLHESYPGHHLQLVIANQKSSFIRKHMHNTPYVEGWALYCEQLMVETDYLKKREQQIFQLKDQLWRAARVILDVKLHLGQMDFKEAVDFLVKRVHLEKNSAEAEVRRYTLAPTYQLSYLLGKLEILALREKLKKIMGKNFSLLQFHQLFLSCGSIPIKLAGKEILMGLRVRP